LGHAKSKQAADYRGPKLTKSTYKSEKTTLALVFFSLKLIISPFKKFGSDFGRQNILI